MRVRGISKRQTEPRVLAIDDCRRVIGEIPEEPFRTMMVILDMATGLRCSELLALQWSDFNWEGLTLMVRRAIVDGVVNEVKARYSRAGLPLDPALAEMAWRWKMQTAFAKPGDWVFASPFQGGRMPYPPGAAAADLACRTQSRHRGYRLAYVPPHLLVPAPCKRRGSEGPAGAPPACGYPHDHERLYAGDERPEAAGPHHDRAPGA